MSSLPLVITAGEPAGIGPDLIVELAQHAPVGVPWVCVCDPLLLQQRAKMLGLPLQIISYQPGVPVAHVEKSVTVLPVSLSVPSVAGQADPANADYVIKTLKIAGEACLQGEFGALVTGPVHKGVIQDAGISFSGHTEFFAKLTHTQDVVMMLAHGDFRVALLTTHLPLAKVAGAITATRLQKTLSILQQELARYFDLPNPRIAVCGLNPHAGENGHFGREEIEVISPVLTKLREQGLRITGPLPADTAFTPQNLAKTDVVVAMYHDQGLPVVKHAGFGHVVNITLGLPIIRTSVDHGTAFDLAGTGKAEVDSLREALKMANVMAEKKAKWQSACV